ncbi:hypothetical protein SAMN05216371_8193 [Streptomyces sp. TLI_053]|nr:hypothetical protein SAMN05216371_8193 [Streptomyces sp. TLI_053]
MIASRHIPWSGARTGGQHSGSDSGRTALPSNTFPAKSAC